MTDENDKLITLFALKQLAQMVSDISTQIYLKNNVVTEKIVADKYLLSWINNLPNKTVIVPLSREILADERNNILVSWNGLYQMQGTDFIITRLDNGYDYETKDWSNYVADGIQLLRGNIMKGDNFIVQYCPNPLLTPAEH